MTGNSSPAEPIEGTDPARAALVALVALHGLVRLSERYLGAYLVDLGRGPIAVGLAGSAALAVAVGARHVGTPDLDGIVDADGNAVAALAAALAAGGLLLWAGAPALDALLGTPITALGWVLAGVLLLAPWHAIGPGAALSLGDGGVALSAPGGAADRRRVAGALGVGGAAALATVVFAGADGLAAGVALLAATGAAIGLAAATAAGTAGGSALPLDVDPPATNVPSLADLRAAFAALPAETGWAILGDALVRFAAATTSLLLALVVVDARAVGLSVGAASLSPAATFGLFVLAEAAGAAAGAAGARTLGESVDRRWLLAGGYLVVSLVPLALVAAPATPWVFALAFAAFGGRTALGPHRPTVGPSDGTRFRAPPEIGAAVRIALVPAPLVGGVLYAISPVTAFGIASTIGVLGARELVRTAR